MNTNKFLKELIIIIIGGFIINVICFFIGSIYSRAASDGTYPFPYAIQDSGYNTIFELNQYNAIINQLNDEYGYNSSNCEFLIYPTEHDTPTETYARIKYNVILNPRISSTFYLNGNESYRTTSVPVVNDRCWEFRVQYSWGNVTVSTSNISRTENTVYLLGAKTSNVTQFGSYSGTFTNFYPVYLSNSGLYDLNNQLVIAQTYVPNVPVSGTVTGPNTGHYIPNHDNTGTPTLPTRPIINNYTWTTYNNPPIDTSTLENLVESLIDVVTYNFSYLFTNLSGLFSNIISNIKNFIDYIQDTLLYVGRSIQDSIKNAIDLIYDNLVSLFEPILNDISERFWYITQELDSEVIYDSFSSSDFGSDFTSIKTNINTFVTSFNSVSEPSSYTIPIHIENVSIFSNVSTQYIDLGWLNSVKTPLRAFVWCIVTYGLIMSIIDSIPNYINGGGGEDD